jgi:hypothetical protein
MERPTPISRCDVCAEIADRAFESRPENLPETAAAFLSHVIEKHPGEILGLIAERYGPIFLAKREMR